MGDFKVSWMTDLYRPPFLELANLDSKSAQAFCSLRTCTSSNVEKASFKNVMYLRYEANCWSLAWYSSVTCSITNNESLFAKKLWAPHSLANNIPTITASYLAWLLLALKANLKTYSINSPLGPCRMTLALLPCWLKDLSTERTHWKSLPSIWVASDDSSVAKLPYIQLLIDPLGPYCTSNSDKLTAQRTIRPAMSGF